MSISALLGFVLSRNAFWPGIAELYPVQERSNFSSSSNRGDLHVNSSLQISAKTPYQSILRLADYVLPGESYIAIGLTSSLTICLATSLLILAFYSSSHEGNPYTSALISPQILFAHVVYLVGVTLILVLPHGTGIYLAGYGLFTFPWATPEYLSVVINSMAFLVLFINNVNRKSTKILVFTMLLVGTLIHPASSIFFALTIMTFRLALISVRRSDFIVVSGALISGLLIMFVFFASGSNSLNAIEFSQIYAEWRHPHHYVPSNYLNKFNVSFYLFSFLLVLTICRKSFRHKLLIFSLFFYTIFFNLVQFFAVEVHPIKPIVIFGPSRVNNYIFISLYMVLVLFVNSRLADYRMSYVGSEKADKKYRRFTSFSLISVMVLFFTANYVSSDYRDFKMKIQSKMSSLKLEKGDLVFVEPSIDTTGWREFGNVSIWFDGYFPFEFTSIKIYRERWLQICETKNVSTCFSKSNKDHTQKFLNIMTNNQIHKAVFSYELTETFLEGEYELIAKADKLWSYRILD